MHAVHNRNTSGDHIFNRYIRFGEVPVSIPVAAVVFVGASVTIGSEILDPDQRHGTTLAKEQSIGIRRHFPFTSL